MDDALYREEILEHYKRPHHWGVMEAPDREFSDTNPLCGDELKVMLRVDGDGKIEDVRFDGHGCAISQAAASIEPFITEGAAAIVLAVLNSPLPTSTTLPARPISSIWRATIGVVSAWPYIRMACAPELRILLRTGRKSVSESL